MGLFDRFKKEKNNLEKNEEVFPGANKWFSGCDKWEEEEMWNEAYEAFYNDLAKSLNDAKIKYATDDYEVLEIRAKKNNRPLRVKWDQISYDEPEWVEIEMKCNNTLGTIDLERNYDKIPKKKDADPDWGDDDQTMRVFLQKGIYAEGDEDEVNETLSVLNSFPQLLIDKILSLIEEYEIIYFRLNDEVMSAIIESNIVDLKEPIKKIITVIDLLEELTTLIDSNKLQKKALDKNISAEYKRVKCDFCSTMFLMGKKSNCPNCGGAYTE
jgi:hypothetical protein